MFYTVRKKINDMNEVIVSVESVDRNKKTCSSDKANVFVQYMKHS